MYQNIVLSFLSVGPLKTAWHTKSQVVLQRDSQSSDPLSGMWRSFAYESTLKNPVFLFDRSLFIYIKVWSFFFIRTPGGNGPRVDGRVRND